MGQKEPHRGNPVGFFYTQPSFFLPFSGDNAAHFSRVTFAPSRGQNPASPADFFRIGDKPKIVNLTLLHYFRGGKPTANNGENHRPNPHNRRADKPHRNIPYLPLNATKPLLFCCVRRGQKKKLGVWPRRTPALATPARLLRRRSSVTVLTRNKISVLFRSAPASPFLK